MTGAAEGAVADNVRRHGHVGIGKNDDRIFGSALALRAFSARSSASVDVFRHGCRTDKTDRADFRVIKDRVNSRLAAVNKVYNPLRQTNLLEQFEGAFHRQRHALARLQHKRVAGSDCVRKEPERNHGGKVECGNCGYDTHRLANHRFVNAAGDVLKIVALHHHRNAACDLDVFDSAAKLGFRFAERLPVFNRDQAAQFVEVLFEQHFQFEERLNSVFGRCAAPFRKCGCGSFDRGVHFGHVGKWDFSESCVRRRVNEILPFG